MHQIDDENTKNASQTVHVDLIKAKELAYDPCGFICKNLVKEAESEEYGAFVFEMNNRLIKFRSGKITPKKIGQFVTLWKRSISGVILPHDLADPFDLFVISVRNTERLGQFVFPKLILFEKGIVSDGGKGGKLAIRIYPPWDVADSRQAKKTQDWQLKYYFEIQLNGNIDTCHVQKLFSC